MTDERIITEALRNTLVECIKENENRDWVDHTTVMNDARKIIESARRGEVTFVLRERR